MTDEADHLTGEGYVHGPPLRLRVLEWCPPENCPRRIPVLMIHGFTQTAHSWDTTAPALAKMGHHVVALDLRGHGESEWSKDGDYSRMAMVGDIIRVIHTYFCRKCINRQGIHLVGLSMGGALAVTTALVLGPKKDLLYLVKSICH